MNAGETDSDDVFDAMANIISWTARIILVITIGWIVIPICIWLNKNIPKEDGYTAKE